MADDLDGTCDEGALGDLSLGHRAAIARMEASLFGAPERPVIAGRLVILERIGSGAAGRVYAAYDPELDRKVALKVLHDTRPAAQAMLAREAKALAALAHPNVVAVYDVGTLPRAEGSVFVAMEHVAGRTLRRWLADERPTTDAIVAAFVGAASGLAAAHAAGLVHRDFKPDNVLMGHDGRVRVADFGLARALLGDGRADSERSDDDDDGSGEEATERTQIVETRCGRVVGTPAYMSPQLFEGQAADASSDQFAFGVALWEALCGDRPFAGDTLLDLTANVRAGRRRRFAPRRPVGGHVRSAIERALAHEPHERHPSMQALVDRLARDPARRRRRHAITGAIVVTAMLGTFMFTRPEHEDPCPAADDEARLDPARRDAHAAAFEATGLVYAADAASRTADALQTYAERWAVARRDACEATRVRREQSETMLDLRMACLHERRRAFEALVTAFEDADASTVERSVQAVASLPAIERCADRAALKAAVPPPDDPAVRHQVEVIDEELSHARAALATGRHADGLARAQAVQAAAIGTAYAPIIAEAYVTIAELQTRVGSTSAAIDAAREAVDSALGGGDDARALRAIAALVFATSHDLRHADDAKRWARTGQALAARLDDDALHASLDNALANLHLSLGELEPAREGFARAIAAWRRVDRQEPHIGPNLAALGTTHMRAGHFDEAESSLQEARERIEATYGSDHPVAIATEINLGLVSLQRGDFARAHERMRAALEHHLRVLPEAHPHVPPLLVNLSIAALQQGHVEEAIAHGEGAVRVGRQLHGAHHPMLAQARVALADALRAGKRLDEALEQGRLALETLEQEMGPEHPMTAMGHTAVSGVSLARNEHASVITHARRALEIVQAVHGDHPELLPPLIFLGEGLLATGEHSEAEAVFRRGLRLLDDGMGNDRQRADVLFGLARALIDDPRRARAHAEQALAVLPADTAAEDRATMRAWLDGRDQIP